MSRISTHLMLETAKQRHDKILLMHVLDAQKYSIGMAHILHATTAHEASSRNIPFNACPYVIYASHSVSSDSSALIPAVAPWQV